MKTTTFPSILPIATTGTFAGIDLSVVDQLAAQVRSDDAIETLPAPAWFCETANDFEFEEIPADVEILRLPPAFSMPKMLLTAAATRRGTAGGGNGTGSAGGGRGGSDSPGRLAAANMDRDISLLQGAEGFRDRVMVDLAMLPDRVEELRYLENVIHLFRDHAPDELGLTTAGTIETMSLLGSLLDGISSTIEDARQALRSGVRLVEMFTTIADVAALCERQLLNSPQPPAPETLRQATDVMAVFARKGLHLNALNTQQREGRTLRFQYLGWRAVMLAASTVMRYRAAGLEEREATMQAFIDRVKPIYGIVGNEIPWILEQGIGLLRKEIDGWTAPRRSGAPQWTIQEYDEDLKIIFRGVIPFAPWLYEQSQEILLRQMEAAEKNGSEGARQEQLDLAMRHAQRAAKDREHAQRLGLGRDLDQISAMMASNIPSS